MHGYTSSIILLTHWFYLSHRRFNNRDKIKFGHAARSNVLGEKFTWFLEKIGERKLPPTPEEFNEMISL